MILKQITNPATNPNDVMPNYVAWETDHNQTYTGNIVFDGYDDLLVKLPHGGSASVKKSKCRPATTTEVLACCDNFSKGQF